MKAIFALCLIVLAVGSVQADDDECKCTEIKAGKWDIKFSGVDDFPLAEKGTMDLKHDFDELYHGKVYSTKMGLPANMEIMGFLNATACVFRGSMANVLKDITVIFTWDLKSPKQMQGKFYLRYKGDVSKDIGSNEASFKEESFLHPELFKTEPHDNSEHCAEKKEKSKEHVKTVV